MPRMDEVTGNFDDRRGAGRQEYPGDLTSVTLARLEAKVDSLAQVQAMRHDALVSDIKHIRETQLMTSSDHELRLRTLESRAIDPTRVYALEQRRYVEPKTVWTALALVATVAGVVVAVINVITR